MQINTLISNLRASLNAGDFDTAHRDLNELEGALLFTPVNKDSKIIYSVEMGRRPPKKDHLVAICIGHSRPGDKGAESADGKVNEWTYNAAVAAHLGATLGAHGVRCLIVDKYIGNDYPSAMKNLGKYLANIKATLAVELHCNSYDGKAKGHEVFCYSVNPTAAGYKLATYVNKSIGNIEQAAPSRGVKQADSRGLRFFIETPCPAILVEPFFMDNPESWSFFRDAQKVVASAIGEGIVTYINS